jgi:hypothetical protein
MSWAATDSNGSPSAWSPVTGFDVRAHDQIMPWVKTDHSRDIINIAYLSSQLDIYGHRLEMVNVQIDAGTYKSNPPIFASAATEPNADYFLGPFFFGDYIGLAARGNRTGSRAYVGFTGTIFKGIVQGRTVPGQNNLMSAVDY